MPLLARPSNPAGRWIVRLLAPAAVLLHAPAVAQTPPAPPKARIIPKVTTLHGQRLVDNYFWLREKANPEVIAYLEAENAYTAAMTGHLAPMQEQLYREMLGRLKESDLSVPERRAGWLYSVRTEQGKGYPVFVRRRAPEAPEEVVLDQNARAQGKKFHGLGGFDVSPDGNFLVFLEDTTAYREYTLYVKDLRSGHLVDTIPGVWNGTAWATDNRTFFYLTADSAKRGNTVWRHVTGSPHRSDARVFQENDVLNDLSVNRTRSGAWILIGSSGYTSAEWRAIPAGEPTVPAKVIAPRRAGVEYSVDHGGGYFYRYTNEGARNFRIARAPETDLSPGAWRDWLPHRDTVFVEGLDVFKDFVVVAERAGGLRRLRVTALGSGDAHYIAVPEDAYGVFPGQNPEFDTGTFRFNYSSLVTPNSVYDYDLAARTRELRKRQEIPSGHDPARYEVRRLFAPARDGVRVPVSILMPKGTALDGSSPLLLYAYGSYGATLEPTFNPNVLSLVDRGVVYAIAHIRGGQEMGRQWYDDGKMLKKKNTFHDFIDVADELVRLRYTSPDRLIANGGSAGGLLMGAVVNIRLDLFKAVVAEVPFVDVINTMLDGSIPLTAQEWEQWGDPRKPDHFAYMLSYSPYDNVAAKAYPRMLVTTSLNDSQVGYWEPAKWVAKLRATKTDDNPLLFRINMAGGHGGASGRYDRMRERAFVYAFMLDAVGLASRPMP